MKRIIIGLALLAFMVLLCSKVSAQEGPHLIFDENTTEQAVMFTTHTHTATFNIADKNLTIKSDLSVFPQKGNILAISIRITKQKTDDYVIYVLKDPKKRLTSIIDRVSFDRPPMAIKDSELAWRVAGNATEFLIQGTVEPATPFLTGGSAAGDELWMENTTLSIAPADFQQNSRKPRISERVSLGIKDRIDILRSTVGFKQITVFALFTAILVGLLVWYYKKRNVVHDKLYSKTKNKGSLSSRNNQPSIDGDIITKQSLKH